MFHYLNTFLSLLFKKSNNVYSQYPYFEAIDNKALSYALSNKKILIKIEKKEKTLFEKELQYKPKDIYKRST